MKKSKLVYAIISLNVLLALGQLYLTTHRATDGEYLATLYQRTEKLNLDNIHLAAAVYSQASLHHIQSSIETSNSVPLTVSFFAPPSVAQAR